MSDRKSAIYKYTLMFYIVLWVSGCHQFDAKAQDSTFFKANGKDVNIETFNQGVSEMMDEMGVPALSLAIIENDEVVFYEAYGVKRQGEGKKAYQINYLPHAFAATGQTMGEKVNRETVFNGASLSKTWLVFVALQLVDEGKLDLDKPMYQYMTHERLADDERYKLITPRMILSHCSGIENWPFLGEFPNKLEILTEPGEEFVYSGEGYNYLSEVMELLLQQSYEEFVTERVIKPLKLENTYLKYKEENGEPTLKGGPWNYTSAHTFGNGQYFIKNIKTEPAYGNHFTAEDYAKLVVNMFNTSHLSVDRKRDMLEPQVRIGESTVYYGPGFELNFIEGDTIISHGGDNPGYKNLMFYSPVKKRGFVLLANNDRGKSMAAKLNEMTVNLNLDLYLAPASDLTLTIQYPSAALSLLKTYDEKDSAGMFSALEELKAEGKIDAMAFSGLGHLFIDYGDNQIAQKVLEDAKAFFPEHALTYCLLGEYYLDNEDYKLALENFNKGKALNFSDWDIDEKIKTCKENLVRNK